MAGYALAGAWIPGARGDFVAALFADKALRAFGHLAAGGVALFAGHRAWMIRSYALCLAAVALRIYLPISFL